MHNILKFIKSKRIIYRYLSEKMGYSSTHISRVLTGKNPVTEVFLIKLYKAIEEYLTTDLREWETIKENK